MALIHSFESSGNWLFKRRGFIPAILFVLAIPVVLMTDYNLMNQKTVHVVNGLSSALSIIGFCIRAYAIGTTPGGTSGRNTDKQVAEQLNSSGIYSIVHCERAAHLA